MYTPWGGSDYEKNYGPGVTFYGTPSHGGFRVADEHNTLIHEAFRHPGGWYEEDCECAIVFWTFPDLFVRPLENDDDPRREDWSTVEKVQQNARKMLVNYFPDQWERMTGETVTAEESYAVAKREFEAKTANRFVVRSAWGDWHEKVPAGMVGVLATRKADGEDRYFLVPGDEYSIPRAGGFVIDETAHKTWGGPKTSPPTTAQHLVRRSDGGSIKASA